MLSGGEVSGRTCNNCLLTGEILRGPSQNGKEMLSRTAVLNPQSKTLALWNNPGIASTRYFTPFSMTSRGIVTRIQSPLAPDKPMRESEISYNA